MAKNQKIMNKSSDQLFHKVNGSKVKDGVTPPMLNTVMKGDGLGVPMADVSSPNKWLPLVGLAARAVLPHAARWVGKQGAKWMARGMTQGVKKSGQKWFKNKAGKFASNPGKGFLGKVEGGMNYLTGRGGGPGGFTTKNWLGRAASYATAATVPSMFAGGSGGDSSSLSENLNKTLDNVNKVGGKITGALGSELRRQQYDAKGWKHDHTISGDHEGSYNSKKKPVKKVNEVKPSGTTTTTSNTDKQPDLPVSTHQTTGSSGNQIKSKKQQKKEKLTNKANIAAAQGNYNKANRLNKRSNRVSPNVVNLDMGAEYSQNLQGSKTKVGAAIQGVKAKVGGAVSNLLEGNKESNNAPKNNNTNPVSAETQLNELDLKGSPFKRKGCGPRGLGSY